MRSTCRGCGEAFGARHPAQAYCLKPDCRALRAEQRRAYARAWEKARRQAGKPRGRVCAWCGKGLPDDARTSRVFCSRSCANADYRGRDPEREAARVREWKSQNAEQVREGHRRYRYRKARRTRGGRVAC